MANKNYRIGILLSLQDKMSERLARIDGQAKKLETTSKRLNRSTISPTVKLSDRISAPLRTIESKLKSLGRMTLIAGGAGAAAAAGGIGYGLKLAGEMEQANIAFETMLGSADKAKRFLEDLTAFAVSTPFEMPQLQDASRKLLAFGFASEKVIPMLTAVGNAASGLGLGDEGMQRIIIALGQMKAKAKISGEEMLQLTEAGVPAWDILAKSLGKSTAEVMKLSSKGLIPADQAIDALVKGMNEKFPDMMMKQSRSLFGLISTLKDFGNLKFFWAFGEGIRQAAVPALQRFVDMLDKNEEGTNRIQERLMELGRTVGNFVVNKFESLYKWLEKLSSNETFQKMSFGDKFIFVINQGLDQLSAWLDGPGSEKVAEIFTKTAGVAVQAWWTGLKGLTTGGIKSLFKGDFDAAAGQLLFANLISGGLLAMGGGALLKKGGGTVFKKMADRKGAKALSPAAEKVAKQSSKAKKAVSQPVSKMKIPTETEDLLNRYQQAGGGRTKLNRYEKLVARYQNLTGGADDIVSSTTRAAGKSSPNPAKLLSRFGSVTGKGGFTRLIGATKILGRVAAPLAIAGEIAQVVTAKDKTRAAATGGAGLAGMAGGAKLGALAGTAVLPGIGTAVGGVLGGAIGYFAGKKLAGTVYDSATANKKSADTSKESARKVDLAASKVVESQERVRQSLDQLGLSAENASSRIGGMGSAGGNVLPFATIMRPIPHAKGGIFNRPHMGLVAEAGPEAIIPLSPGQRNRGLGIWAQAGRQLGIAGSGSLQLSISDVSVSLINQYDEDELALLIGRQIVANIKQQIENQAS